MSCRDQAYHPINILASSGVFPILTPTVGKKRFTRKLALKKHLIMADLYHTCTCRMADCAPDHSQRIIVGIDFEYPDHPAEDNRMMWVTVPCRICGGRVLIGSSFASADHTGEQLLEDAHKKAGRNVNRDIVDAFWQKTLQPAQPAAHPLTLEYLQSKEDRLRQEYNECSCRTPKYDLWQFNVGNRLVDIDYEGGNQPAPFGRRIYMQIRCLRCQHPTLVAHALRPDLTGEALRQSAKDVAHLWRLKDRHKLDDFWLRYVGDDEYSVRIRLERGEIASPEVMIRFPQLIQEFGL